MTSLAIASTLTTLTTLLPYILLLTAILAYFRMLLSAKYLKGRIPKRYWITCIAFPFDIYCAYCEEYHIPKFPLLASLLYIFAILGFNLAVPAITGLSITLPNEVLYTLYLPAGIIGLTVLACNLKILDDMHMSTWPFFLGLLCPPIYEIYTSTKLFKNLRKNNAI